MADSEAIVRGVADTGATITISGNRNLFLSLSPCFVKVECANGQHMICEQRGTIVIVVDNKTIVLKNALYIPNSAVLVSISQLTDEMNFVATFDKTGMSLYKSNQELSQQPFIRVNKQLNSKLWHLPLKSFDLGERKKRFSKAKAFFAKFDDELDPNFVHKRYNHISLPYLKKLFPQFVNVQKLANCDACNAMAPRSGYRKTYLKPEDEKVLSLDLEDNEQQVPGPPEDLETVSKTFLASKERGEHFSGRPPDQEKAFSISKHDFNQTKGYGRYFSSDTKEATVSSVRGYSYLFIVIDHDTKVVECFPGSVKSDFEGQISFFLRNFYNAHKRFPAFWKFDSGGENLNHEIKNLFQKMGIKAEYTTTAAHNQNSHVERTIEAIWTYMKKILLEAGMPLVFWCYAAHYVVFVMNHMPNRSLNMESPLKRANMKQHYDKLRIFGCEVWFSLEGATSKDARKRRGVFLGISDLKMGYDVLDIESGEVIRTRNVSWNEKGRPFLEVKPPMLLELDVGIWPTTVPTYKVTDPLFYGPNEERGENNAASFPTSFQSERPAGSLPLQGTLQNFSTADGKTSEEDEPLPKNDFPSPKNNLQNTTSDLKQSLETVPEEPDFEQNLESVPADISKIVHEELDLKQNLESVPDDISKTIPDKISEHSSRIQDEKPTVTGDETTILLPPRDQEQTITDSPSSGETIVSETILSPILGEHTPKSYRRDVSWLNEWSSLKAPTAKPDFSMFRKPDANDPLVLNENIDPPVPKTKFFHKLKKKKKSKETVGSQPSRTTGRYVELHPEESKMKTFSDEAPGPDLEWDPEEQFTVTGIKDVRNINGVKEYLVSWADTHRGTRWWDPTWEPAENLTGCSDLIDKFNNAREPKDPPHATKKKTPNVSKVPREGTRKSERLRSSHHKVYYSGTIPVDEPDPIFNEPLPGRGKNKYNPEEIPPPPSYEEHHHFVPDDINLEEAIQMAYQAIEEILEGINTDDLKAPKQRHNMLDLDELIRNEFIKGEWRELAGIRRHGTYILVICPKGRKPITCRWVYDIKRDAEGKIKLFKARLVVHGYKQVEGIDFQKTFSSTIQMRTFRLIVALAVNLGLKLTQYDISNAFLNGTLEEEVYMEPPPGYTTPNGMVWKLLKGLYGLKQASRIWQETLYGKLKEVGMKVCKTESGILYIRCTSSNEILILACWVDDLIIATKNNSLREKIEGILEKHFITKILGALSLYVGVVVEQKSLYDAFLHQKPYAKGTVKKYIGDDVRISKIPASSTERLSKIDCPVTDEEKEKIKYPYINATGSLLYLVVCTRPDMFYGTMQLAKFNANPGEKHVKASKMMLRYLAGTLDDGLHFSKDARFEGNIIIEAYVDSDWAGDPDTRRSTCGYIVHVNGCPVSWKSRTMKTMALSSCEAEFMSLTEVCREVMWMCRFFDELGIEYHMPEIYSDSSSALNWTEDPIQHQRNKHVEVKYYYVRDMVAGGNVKTFKITSINNISDIMTKPVGKQILTRLKPPAMGWRDVIRE